MAFRRLFGRNEDPTPPLTCARATPEWRGAALSSILGASVAASPAFERKAASEGVDLSLLWVAQTGGTFIGATLLVPHPGRTALLMTTAPRDTLHAQQIGQLISITLKDSIELPEVRLIQSLSSPSESLRATAWTAGGMRHLASLDYMERAIQLPLPVPQPLPEGITLQQFNPRHQAALQSLLADTYIETLDCPGLAEMRTTQDILNGHLAAGEFDPTLWTIAYQGEIPVAALLLSPSHATDSVEVVYLGLIPAARGVGLGRAMLHYGIQLIAKRSERVLALAVDARNTPAVALYARAGFRTLRRREAYVAHPAPYPQLPTLVK